MQWASEVQFAFIFMSFHCFSSPLMIFQHGAKHSPSSSAPRPTKGAKRTPQHESVILTEFSWHQPLELIDFRDLQSSIYYYDVPRQFPSLKTRLSLILPMKSFKTSPKMRTSWTPKSHFFENLNF